MSAEVRILYRRYRPSNGTEGMMFIERWCERCVRDNPEKEEYCDILNRTLMYNLSDPEYPTEWIEDDDMNPRCTAFEAKP